MSGINYKLCCLYNSDYGKCGPFLRNRIEKEGLVSPRELGSCTESHFQQLQLIQVVLSDFKWSERDLIESRIRRSLHDSEVICEYHRNSLGISWKQPTRCLHNDHEKPNRGKKSPATSPAPFALVNSMNKRKPFSFIVGGRLCYKHRLEEYNSIGATPVTEPFVPDDVVDASDEYVPPVPYIPPSVEASASESHAKLTQILQISPGFRIKKTPISKLASNTRRGIKRKFKQANQEFNRRFAESIAPGQGEELLQLVNESSESDEEDTSPPDSIKPYLETYENSDSKGKLIVLSIICNEYSKESLMSYFGCSRYKIDLARRLKARTEGVKYASKEPYKRNRINTEKLEDFIRFLFASDVLQDVAYGVTTIHFDDNSKETIPHAVLQTTYTHAISLYKDICKETSFVPLSDSTLWKILNTLKPSQRKSLSV